MKKDPIEPIEEEHSPMEGKSLFYKLSLIFPVKERWYFVGLFFLSLIGTALDFFGVSLILPLVNMLVTPGELEGKWWFSLLKSFFHISKTSDAMLVVVLLIIAVYILKNVYAIYMSVVQGIFLARNRINTSAKFLNCYMRKPYTFHLQHNTAEVVRSINSDVSSAYSLVSSIMGLISNGLITILLVAYLISVDPKLTLAIVAGLTIYSVLYFLIIRKKMRAAGQESRRLSVRMIKAIHQSVGGIKEVKVMGREQYFVDSYSENGDAFIDNQKKYIIYTGIPRHLIEILCVVGVLGLVAFKIATDPDNLSAIVGSLSAFAVAAIKLLPSANSINSTINGMTYLIPSLDAVCEVIDDNFNHPNVSDTCTDVSVDKSDVELCSKDSDITLTNIFFTYPEMDDPVLKDVNLTIRHGTSVGIMGVTGAGKTTLVDIILGLLEPQVGKVYYGDLDISKDYAEWQKHIGYIPQNIYLTDESIRNNVALGVYEDDIDDERVWKALEDAQLADFVRGLKDGLDTVIGERGVRISGGQRQRIGIARALYYNPDILFFDEATAALDTETERAVMASVNRLSREKTCIIIAHRLSTIEQCDIVYKVENNQVHEANLQEEMEKLRQE